MKTPCKNCELRTVGCHGKCVSYIMHQVKMDRLAKERKAQCDVVAYVGNNIKHIRNRMRKGGYVLRSNYSE